MTARELEKIAAEGARVVVPSEADENMHEAGHELLMSGIHVYTRQADVPVVIETTAARAIYKAMISARPRVAAEEYLRSGRLTNLENAAVAVELLVALERVCEQWNGGYADDVDEAVDVARALIARFRGSNDERVTA